jgi:flagellar biosynthetic protein FliP
MKNRLQKLFFFFAFVLAPAVALAAPRIEPKVDINGLVGSPMFSNSVQLILSLSLISLLPFFLMSCTAFMRIVITFSFVRTAIGTQQVPPGPVLIAISIFLTGFVMTPVWNEINANALAPYNRGEITQAQAFTKGMDPLRKFMFRNTREADLALFVEFSKIPTPKTFEEVPTYVLIPSFMISELKTAFQIGFLLLIPFIMIDLIVSNILLTLGMFMLSPVMVSLPFKILLFVLVDGWNLLCRGLLMSFR